MTISDVLNATGNLIIWPTLILSLFHRISRKKADGFLAIAWLLFALRDGLEGDRLVTCIDSAFAAWHLYDWWNNGGGDDTKRRLRDALKKFQPVRRTAPSAA